MSSENLQAVKAFIDGAPPGELTNVVKDITTLTEDQPQLLQSAGPAFERYTEEQLTVVKLPGASQTVLVSVYNRAGNGRYYDTESSSSYAFNHSTQTTSAVQSYTPDSQHQDLIKSFLKALSSHAKEHYTNATYGVYPTDNDSALAIVLVANKYSPMNYWSGRWRTTYTYNPSTSGVEGTIHVEVHYYEDGNVRLSANKRVSLSGASSATDALRKIALEENKYQEELNRGFTALNEGAFKSLRRQLPVTRQKVEWEKIRGYRLGQDIGGGVRAG